MTAKRFIVKNIMFDGDCIVDTTDKGYYTTDKQDLENLCELLNEQHEQIQELIQSSKELEEDCQSTFNAMSRKQDDLYRKNFKLKEENQRLKQNIDELLSVDIEEELLEENEQLKQENQSWLKTASHLDTIAHEDRDYAKRMHKGKWRH